MTVGKALLIGTLFGLCLAAVVVDPGWLSGACR